MSANPRLFPIPIEIQGIIQRKFAKIDWSEDRIASFTQKIIEATQKKIDQYERAIWNYLESNIPEIKDFPNGKAVDYITMRIVSTEEATKDQYIKIPENLHVEIIDLMEEIESLKKSTGLLIISVNGIREEISRQVHEINSILQRYIPECAEGNWEIDIYKMVVVESFNQTKD